MSGLYDTLISLKVMTGWKSTMISKGYHFSSIQAFLAQRDEIGSPDLVQLYSSMDQLAAQAWAQVLSLQFPQACRVGMAVPRHICNGEVYDHGVTLIFSYPTETHILHHCIPVTDEPFLDGQTLFTALQRQSPEQAHWPSIVLLDDYRLVNKSLFYYANDMKISVSGGKSCLPEQVNGWILYQSDILTQHILAIAFVNPKLHSYRDSFVDTVNVGRFMQITSADGRHLKQLNYLPAQQVYQHYLGQNVSFATMNRFALQAVDGSTTIQAIPFQRSQDGGFIMNEPLREGLRVQFVYHHPHQSIRAMLPRLEHLCQSPPETMFLFNCTSRNDSKDDQQTNKLSLLNQITSVNGVYCDGEFFTSEFGHEIKQHSLTYLALSESAEAARSPMPTPILSGDTDHLAPLFNIIAASFDDLEQEQTAFNNTLQDTDRLTWLHDPQTNLLNRYALLNRLRNNDDASIGHLALLRIRNFRLINEQYGYDVADNIVSQLAVYLKQQLNNSLLSANFTCYRLSANELAVLLNADLSTPKTIRFIRHLAENIESNAFLTTNQTQNVLSLSLSVGVASIKDKHNQTICLPSHLLIKASEARRHAHQNNQPIFWSGDLPHITNKQDNLDWIANIKHCLDNNKIIPYFQPYFDSQTGLCCGAEALMRANIHDKVIGPNDFLDLIKQTQLYPKLTLAMLNHCERVLMAHTESNVSVNLSILDLKHDSTLSALRQFFKQKNIAGRITLEITESESIQDYDLIRPILQEFRRAGALLAIDDFGAGYSNLEKLIEIQPEILKLDGCIIRTIDKDPKLLKLVKHVNALAHSIGIKTQAEFVHNQAVMDTLVALKVDYLQGYHLSEPLSEDAWLHMPSADKAE